MAGTDNGCRSEQKTEIYKELLRAIRRAEQNLTLMETVDRAYREYTGKEGEYTCSELYGFYVKGYGGKDNGKDDGRGLKRTPQKSSFSFVKPYKSATFTAYYLGNDIPTAMFLKSISVSLRLTHTEADALLKAYGYLPFYSKNVFDLAIYSVLMMNEDPFIRQSRSIDSFKMIEDRYSSAIRIIEAETERSELSELSDITTEPIHTSQFLRDAADNSFLRDEHRFLAFVRQNAKYFSIRHGTIVREHEGLIRALNGLYGGDFDGDGISGNSLSGYSLRSLIEKFVDYKGTHYNRDVISLAQKGDSNGFYIPTRELMILMWLYAETFVYNKDMTRFVPCTKRCEREIKQAIVASDEKERKRLCKSFFDNHAFNVREYLFPDYTSTVLTWNGESARQRINTHLSSLGWGVISDNNKFDRVIARLLSFSINASGVVLYSGRTDTILPFEFKDIPVPRPLQLIFGILNGITEQLYAASGDAARRIGLLYLCYERLSAGEKAGMKKEHRELYSMLSERALTEFIDDAERAMINNDILYSVIDSGAPILGERLCAEEIASLSIGKAQRMPRSTTVKELLRGMMVFPLEANTYEKV